MLQKIKNLLHTLGTDLWSIKKFIIINLIGFVALTVIIVQSLMWILDHYTLHGESIETPDLTGMKIEEAIKLLEVKKLEYIVVDSICKGNGLGGIIRQQTPLPKKRVKESRKIYLTITSFDDCSVNLYYDRLIGKDRAYVIRYINRSNLKLGALTYVEGGKAKNTVTEVYANGKPLFIEVNASDGKKPPSQPKKVPQNSVIDLVLLKGIDESPKYIPELICKTYGAAEFAILSSQFNIGNLELNGNITDTASAWVYNQQPAPGSLHNMGTGINLWLMDSYPEACDATDSENEMQ